MRIKFKELNDPEEERNVDVGISVLSLSLRFSMATTVAQEKEENKGRKLRYMRRGRLAVISPGAASAALERGGRSSLQGRKVQKRREVAGGHLQGRQLQNRREGGGSDLSRGGNCRTGERVVAVTSPGVATEAQERGWWQ
jgi:hypothetical protein